VSAEAGRAVQRKRVRKNVQEKMAPEKKEKYFPFIPANHEKPSAV
jgi:hypothetical protein